MSKRKGAGGYDEPGRGRSDRLEEKRQRFANEKRTTSKGLGPRVYLTVGIIALAVIFVGLMTFQNSNATSAASAGVLQQIQASTGGVENGKVIISLDEVKSKKLVAWDYKKGNATTALMAYVTPSGATKVAVRVCEPCNGYSFRIEGNQIVCNTCGTRWDLETSKGVSGGCQGYPPDVLPSSIDGGKITVDENRVSSWKSRI